MQAGRSVGAKCDVAIDDAVTHADVLDVFANGFDYPGGLVADDRWKGRDRKRTSTIINVDEVETYDGVADQCFIVARLTHDDVLEPQDFGRTIFVNTGDSRGGWHDISPFKSASDHRSSARGAARMLPGSWWRMVAAGVICPKAEDRPRRRLKLDGVSAGGRDRCLLKQPLHERGVLEAGHGSRAACEIAGMNLEEIGELQHAARKIRGGKPVVRCGHCEWRHLGVRYAGTE